MNWTGVLVAATLAGWWHQVSNHGMSARMKTVAIAVLIAASFTAPAIAHADDPVPTVDQVVAIMAELTDPNKPAAAKRGVITPGFSPDEAGTINDHLNQTNAKGLLPYNFVVSDIVPASADLAGATVTVTGSFNQASAPQHIVLADQGGNWLITHDAAMTTLDNFWFNANRAPQYCARFWHIEGRC